MDDMDEIDFMDDMDGVVGEGGRKISRAYFAINPAVGG
jgi:hypothetical protein